jgi:hypothetical protein
MSMRLQAIVWMRENLNVVAMFEKFGQQLVDRERRFGINLLRERVRWECIYEHGVDTSWEEVYKFQNSFSPYVARYLLWKHPEWTELMRCKRTADESAGIVLITDTQVGVPH